MIHTPVLSSNLSSVAWQAGTLEIQFKNGRRYRYFDVPEAVFVQLLQAPSKGRYFHRHIKNNYPCAPA
ncbi:hypothetical protein HMPREF9123_1113 [Neisseria bacilliformis ATCC BAA-1200]|uniref:KTSC domain-containing protein n=1 Tax=Neisseria bacilliformis ATCC BAA-1200 TaxID=888742 RepID=F2BBK8_9NEIS|nr:KTSC domain-containing protein [Neisseria bacilliformis]EGF11154.1 hypothetical protein HMPREF9123_1113 [Neisseria bacilliformis ATCC BAA-1200]QMT48193.1 KTSC domain-containing protein [Neisseria bacilliformis]